MVQTIEPDSFKAFVAEREAQDGPWPPGVRSGALRIWRLASERGQNAAEAVREVLPSLFDVAEDATPPATAPRPAGSRKPKTRAGASSDIDRAHAATLAEHAARLAERDAAAWRGFPTKRIGTGTDWAGRWEDVEVVTRDGPVNLRLRGDPILLELPDERPRTPNARPGSELGPLVAGARRLALVFNWSEAEGLHFLMTGRPPKAKPLFARRLSGFDGRAGASIAILAAVHVDPDSVKDLFADEQRKHLGRDKRRGGRDFEERNVVLVRFVEAWAMERKTFDFEEIREGWNRRWRRTRPDWTYKNTSRVRLDYNRTAKAILGRVLKPSDASSETARPENMT